jgi:hypothetical protein
VADYFDQDDIEDAISVNTVLAAYDDDQDGEVDTRPMAACIAYGNAECNSFLRNVLMASSSGGAATLPLTTVPDEVKFAALDFGIAYTIRRRPDIAKAMGEKPWTDFYDYAVAKMKRYCESLQRMPSTAGIHATAGATVLVPESDVDSDDEPDQESRWSDLGDFA